MRKIKTLKENLALNTADPVSGQSGVQRVKLKCLQQTRLFPFYSMYNSHHINVQKQSFYLSCYSLLMMVTSLTNQPSQAINQPLYNVSGIVLGMLDPSV